MTAEQFGLEQLEVLKESLEDWRRYKKIYELKTLKKDRDVRNMVLHAILIAVQACIDIANHLIAHLGLPRPNSYREAFEVLSSYGYLDENTATELQDLASFRNVLVHVYWRLDLDRVFQILQSQDKTIQQFISQMKELLT